MPAIPPPIIIMFVSYVWVVRDAAGPRRFAVKKRAARIGLPATSWLQLADFFQNDFADAASIGLSLGRLHNGSNQGANGLHVTAFDALYDIRVGGHRLVHRGRQSAVVRHHG